MQRVHPDLELLGGGKGFLALGAFLPPRIFFYLKKVGGGEGRGQAYQATPLDLPLGRILSVSGTLRLKPYKKCPGAKCKTKDVPLIPPLLKVTSVGLAMSCRTFTIM